MKRFIAGHLHVFVITVTADEITDSLLLVYRTSPDDANQ